MIERSLYRRDNRSRIEPGGSILMRHFFLVAALWSCFAIGSAKAEVNVRVKYVHPENFTDVSFRSMTRQDAEGRLEPDLTDKIDKAATQSHHGYKLNLHIYHV